MRQLVAKELPQPPGDRGFAIAEVAPEHRRGERPLRELPSVHDGAQRANGFPQRFTFENSGHLYPRFEAGRDLGSAVRPGNRPQSFLARLEIAAQEIERACLGNALIRAQEKPKRWPRNPIELELHPLGVAVQNANHCARKSVPRFDCVGRWSKAAISVLPRGERARQLDRPVRLWVTQALPQLAAVPESAAAATPPTPLHLSDERDRGSAREQWHRRDLLPRKPLVPDPKRRGNRRRQRQREPSVASVNDPDFRSAQVGSRAAQLQLFMACHAGILAK